MMTKASSPNLSGFIDDLRKKPILLCALLVLAILLLYGGVAHHQFLVFDDGPYVTKNIHVSTGLSFSNVIWAFTSFHEANWHPVTWLSHMADCQLFGMNPGPQHMINVLLHAANTLLLFLLLQRATGAVWRSLLVAALFAVHPLNVETVAWVAERKSLLCTLFSLLTVASYALYVRQPGLKRYLVVIAAFSLALMSKPMAVTLPILLLLLDYWPLERHEHVPSRRKWVLLSIEKLPLLLISAASSGVTIMAQRSGGAVAEITALPFSLRIENAIVSYAAYIGKMFWPARLAIFYAHPEHALPWFDVAGSAVVIASITLAVVYLRRTRYLVTGWGVFVIALIPVIGIVQVGHQAMADRYAYIPYIGLFVIISWGLGQMATHATTLPRPVLVVAALSVIVALSAVTTQYLQYWQDGTKLFTRAEIVASQPDPTIEEALGDALLSAGRYDEAYQHFGETCLLRPNYAFCHYNMAEILFNRHQLKDALDQYQIAGSLTENKDIGLSCLINSGEILIELGDYETANMRLATVLQIDSNNQTALVLRQRALDLKAQSYGTKNVY